MTAPLRADDRPANRATIDTIQRLKRIMKIGIPWDGATGTILRDTARNRQLIRKPAIGLKDHRPSDPRDFTGPQARLEAKQYYDAVAFRIPSRLDMPE